ncbi:DNA-directed RNA polymerase subunit beta [Staphylococcus sp. IVB6181]|uniref:DNA-directed RNA polymerase subunit beta n=1 Tax=Staphylococcus sp. IVB6181 TaxID=2929481 RepID=UPI0021D313B1|nr:DNA-directed RNA polymerase subunit beta [Staphylococcus sp. IVB6181]UXV35794.1 DNA-directed RNA polymerase subunit beta [Staphylococcus sp. IVB6181]
MIKQWTSKLMRLPMGYHILIVLILLVCMFIIGMCIGFLLNHQNPLKLFDYQTWYHFKQIFGG